MNSARIFWPVVAVLLAVMAGLQVTSALQENQTWDEATHLAAGYSYLKTGDYRMNPEHPPLGKILAALPLLPLHPKLDTAGRAWRDHDEVGLGLDFLYHNRIPADRMLFLARSVMILMTLLLGLAIAIWSRRRFGTGPALLAVFLYALDPNFIAHGHYVTSDVLVSLFVFLACITWNAYLNTWLRRDLLWAALAFAAAAATKFSALFLLPVFLLLFGVKWWQQRGPVWPWLGRLALSMSAIALVTALVIAASYAREVRALTFNKRAYVPLTSRIDRGGFSNRMLRSAGRLLHLPAYSYLLGLQDVVQHDTSGHPSYVLGRLTQKGVWYYFPLAFAVKTPTAVLLLMLMALVGVMAGWLRLSPRSWLPKLRQARFEWFLLSIPPGVYLLLSMYSQINIGLRHILPVYPFLFVQTAAVLFRLGGPGGGAGGFARRPILSRLLPLVLCMAVTLQAAEVIRIHPHYLAFFNTISGGPDKGSEYLVDSNLDWGQDLKNLKKWIQRHGKPRLCVMYFGNGDLDYYGVQYQEAVPATWDVKDRANLNCVVAISATVLRDVYMEPGRHAWLRELRPMGKVGYSIYLYDCRKQEP